MKNIFLVFIGVIGFACYGQETYYKNYKITNFIDFLKDKKHTYDYNSLNEKENAKVKFLSREKCINYFQLSASNKKIIDEQIKLIENGVFKDVKLKDCSSNILLVNENNFNNPLLYRRIGVLSVIRAKTFGNAKDNKIEYKAGLIMEKGRLYVNLWPFKEGAVGNDDLQSDNGIIKSTKRDKNDVEVEVEIKEDKNLNDQMETREALFYEIPDDHTAIFKFTEWNINAITIPLKYRFQTNRSALDKSNEMDIKQIIIKSEEFSTSVNLALFSGRSWGKTKFTHRKKVGNRIKTIKNTIGAFLGSTAVELSAANTNVTLTQPQGDAEGTIGTISFGLGYVKSWNKISVGIFTGIDKGVGRVSNSWVYDGKPWLGIGVGYDLFKM
ncbi:hypothetical protein [uncultured Polaribacter sp.]|uniref:hypothetical protein n=1 Tax=uncultured Polaribacter sp. TaxID=174711 RepID=UPI0026083125|nr:hypothetical protein [uncultured Polaribacter sp.]